MDYARSGRGASRRARRIDHHDLAGSTHRARLRFVGGSAGRICLRTRIYALPFAGALVILFLPKERTKAVHAVALAATALSLAVSLYALSVFEPGSAQMESLQMQFVERFSWIPSLDVHYYLGVDGLSLPIIILIALLSH